MVKKLYWSISDIAEFWKVHKVIVRRWVRRGIFTPIDDCRIVRIREEEIISKIKKGSKCKNVSPFDEFLPLKEVIKQTGVSLDSLYLWIKEGKINWYRIHGTKCYRLKLDEVIEAMERNKDEYVLQHSGKWEKLWN